MCCEYSQYSNSFSQESEARRSHRFGKQNQADKHTNTNTYKQRQRDKTLHLGRQRRICMSQIRPHSLYRTEK